MKTVFNKSEVAHVWAQQNQDHGRTSSDNFSFHGPKIYSYSTCMGWFVQPGVVILDDAHYSVTTSRHQQLIKQALHSRIQKIFVPGADPSDSLLRNANKCVGKAISLLETVATRKVRAYGKVSYTLREALEYTDAVRELANVEDDLKQRAQIESLYYGMDRLMVALSVLLDELRCDGTKQVTKAAAEALLLAIKTYNAQAHAASLDERFAQFIVDLKETEARDPIAATLRAWLALDDAGSLYNRITGQQQKLWRARVKRMQVKHVKVALASIVEPASKYPNIDTLEHKQRVLACFSEHMWATGLFEKAANALDAYRTVVVTRGVDELLATGAEDTQFGYGRMPRSEQLAIAAKGYPELEQAVASAVAELHRRKLEANAEKIAKWRAGEDTYLPHELDTMLRVADDVIETSKGARVPLAVAPALWALVKAARAGKQLSVGTRDRRVGNYTLEEVKSDGSLIIGCHTLPYEELALLAKQLGYQSESDSRGEAEGTTKGSTGA
jgi:hypothetical protein